MAHWESRPEEKWKRFRFNQPYARGLERLRTEVLEKTDFDPATLWQWGTMQAMAVIEVLKACEREFGEKGQKVVYDSLRRVGYDVASQIVEGIKQDPDFSDAELLSFFASVINRIAYASLEDPSIDDEGKVSFHIIWCPHQDQYAPFDCRVQRYFVQGMMEALRDASQKGSWQIKFTCTIPAGADTCHFEIWQATDEEVTEWERYTRILDEKALQHAKKGQIR
jgi:hypothetical protein